MANARRHRASFFMIMSVVAVAAAIIGFAKTFFLPLSQGEFGAPIAIHIHGAFAFSWIFLFLLQNLLIHRKNYRMHAIFGVLGLVVAFGVAITMVPAALFAVEKELVLGFGKTAYSGLLGVLTSGVLFLALVLAGLLNRHRPAYHKRLMLLATVVVLWPAWFRFRHYFPPIPRPDIWFGLVLADSLIVISWIWDKLKNGSVHPALKYVGTFVLLEQIGEIIVFDSYWYQIIAEWLYFFLTG